MGTLFINLPNRPKGDVIEVPPYGLLVNGNKYTREDLEEDVVIGDADATLVEVEPPAEVKEALEQAPTDSPVKKRNTAANSAADSKEDSK